MSTTRHAFPRRTYDQSSTDGNLPEPQASAGSATTRPAVGRSMAIDYHISYALALVVLALLAAGNTWGLGKRWAATPVVRDHAWLR